jgi:hypothetical protein
MQQNGVEVSTLSDDLPFWGIRIKI